MMVCLRFWLLILSASLLDRVKFFSFFFFCCWGGGGGVVHFHYISDRIKRLLFNFILFGSKVTNENVGFARMS